MTEAISQPTISAVIVTYQSDQNMLRRAVDSLKACTLPIDIAIVDNHSGSDYRANLARAFRDVHIIDTGLNKGFGAGHNLGFALREVDTKYHFVVNPDIRVPEGTIEKIIAFMEATPDVGLCVPKIANAQNQLQYVCKRKPTVMALFGRRFLPKFLADLFLKGMMQRYTMRDKSYDEMLEPDFLSGCFMCFRSSIFKQVDGFDERFFLYFEDADITMRTKQVARAVHFPDAHVIHDWKGGARTSGKLTRIMIISAFKFFNKWGWSWW